MIRIGIIGCGRILAAHLRAYRLLREAGVDDFRITALCSRRPEEAASYVSRGEGPPQRPAVSQIPGDPLAVEDEYLSDFQGDVQVEIFTDYRRMIREAPLDAINDFTSHGWHHQVAAEAFDRGLHLLTEKPLAVSVAAARQMCQAAQARDLVFGVFENFRQAPATRQLRWAFESGVCGQLQMILLGYAGVWWAPNRIVAGTPWRHYKNEGGGISLDLGVHFFDQIRHVAGEIKTVQAQTCVLEPQRVTIDEHGRQVAKIDCDADDTFFAQIETEQGVVGNLFASWAGHGAPTKAGQGVVYYSTSGRVTGDEVDLDDGLPPRRLGEMFAVHAAEEDRHRLFPLGLTDSFALNHYDWLQAIRQRRPPETSGEEGLRDLAAAFAILESSLAGRKVEVAEVLDGSRRDYQRPIDAALGLE